MGNPFEDLRQAVVVRPMNSPGPQGAAAPELKIQYSYDGQSWHDDPLQTDRYLRFSTDNGVSWSDAIYFNNLAETLEWVEKARKWAENPENDPVEDLQYSALHHALQAKKSEITAGEYAIDAAGSATEAFGAAAPAWDGETVYNYNDVVSFDNGHTYRCIGTNVVGIEHAPNINGVDNIEEWTRITVSPDGYFEVDENGDFMPMIVPVTSEIFMLDENGDITYQSVIPLSPVYLSEMPIIHVNSFKELRHLPYVYGDKLLTPGLIIHLSSFYINGPQINSNYRYDDKCPKSEANGITKIDLEKMESIGYTHTGTDLETYFLEQGTGTGEGCLVLNTQPVYFLEQAGAIGDGVTDDSIAFNNLSEAIKDIEGATISSYGYTYRLDSMVYVYNHLNIKGKLIITKNESKVGGLTISDTISQRYDELDPSSLGEIKALSNELSGLPAGSEYKYIAILSNEQIPRFNNNEMQYYTKNHYAQIVSLSALSSSANINLGIYPAPPWDIAKENITSIRVYKLRPRLNIELDNIVIDNTEATEMGSNSIIAINRDSVRLSFNNYEQMKIENGAYNQIVIRGNGFIVDGGNFFHYDGYTASNSYGINVGSTCGGLIKNLNASTNWHNIVSRHASNLTIQNSTIHNIDEHMGSNWHIDNCTVSRVNFAGNDLTITNSTILDMIFLREDTPIARGTLRIDNVVFKGSYYRLIHPGWRIQGDFNYDATFFDNVIISNCCIDIESGKGYATDFYSLSEVGTGSWQEEHELPYNKMIPPKLISISNVSISSNVNIRMVSIRGGIFLKETQYVPKIIISDIYNLTSDKNIIPFYINFCNEEYGLKADTEQDIPCLFDLEVRNVDGCLVAADSRGMDKHKLINCENIIFNYPEDQEFDRIGIYEGREDKGITEIIGGSLSILNYDLYRYAKIAMSGVNLKIVPTLESTTYKSKIIKMINCYSELTENIPNMHYYVNSNYFTYSYGPMHCTVSTLPVNANIGSIAFATDALKEGESPGNGTGTMVYYNGTTWVNLYNNAPVAT